jgi:hypothetical protein
MKQRKTKNPRRRRNLNLAPAMFAPSVGTMSLRAGFTAAGNL